MTNKALPYFFWQPMNLTYDEIMKARKDGIPFAADLIYEWRMPFVDDNMDFEEVNVWIKEHIGGVFGVDYRVSLGNYVAFIKEEDAMLCYMAFA